MNVLPMIFAFLLIFAGISFTFLRDTKSFQILESSFEGYQRTERKVNNALAQKAYRKIKGDPVKKNQKEPAIKTSKEFQSRRAFFPPFENSKCNLAPLFASDQNPKSNHPLYEPIATLLRLLYEKSVFSKTAQGGLEYQILDALLEKAKALETVTDLNELIPEDKALQPIYYKLLKGTNVCTEEKGYPPLSDYFSIQPGKLPIYLSFAAPQLLEALFGKEIKEFILNKEQKEWESTKKYVYFSKEELQELIQRYPMKTQLLSLLEPFIDGSKQFAPRKDFGGKDKLSGLAVRKQVKS